MNNILLIVIIVFAISLIIFCISKIGKIREADRRGQEAIRHEASEKVMGPERKLHEEEKKRWEDEYYKR